MQELEFLLKYGWMVQVVQRHLFDLILIIGGSK
jgi:hypothetical protein